MSNDNWGSPKQSDGLHGVSCFAEVRFFKWQQAETSVSLRSKSGSYGGGSEVLVVERHFGSEVRIYENVVPTLKKNMGDGGGNVPMIVEPICFRDDITIKVDKGGLPFKSMREDIKGNNALCREQQEQ